MERKNLNLAKYDMKKLLRNPSLIHQIQDKLETLEGTGFFSGAIRAAAKTNVIACIKTIIESYEHNPKMIKQLIGADTLSLIEEFAGITLADDMKDIL